MGKFTNIADKNRPISCQCYSIPKHLAPESDWRISSVHDPVFHGKSLNQGDTEEEVRLDQSNLNKMKQIRCGTVMMFRTADVFGRLQLLRRYTVLIIFPRGPLHCHDRSQMYYKCQ